MQVRDFGWCACATFNSHLTIYLAPCRSARCVGQDPAREIALALLCIHRRPRQTGLTPLLTHRGVCRLQPPSVWTCHQRSHRLGNPCVSLNRYNSRSPSAGTPTSLVSLFLPIPTYEHLLSSLVALQLESALVPIESSLLTRSLHGPHL